MFLFFNFLIYFYNIVLREGFNALILSCGVYPPLLAWSCISILLVSHVGLGGVDNICWDPQPGGISLNAEWL